MICVLALLSRRAAHDRRPRRYRSRHRGARAPGDREPPALGARLDVAFAEDQSRLRKSHGARKMATGRHFALNLGRAAKEKRSIKSRTKVAGWDTDQFDASPSSQLA